MPPENRFCHQAYTPARPPSPYHTLCAVAPPQEGPARSEQARATLERAAAQWRAQQVAAVYLMHGTFVGADALGLAGELAYWLPTVAQRVRNAMKGMVDHYVGDAGNYTRGFATQLQEGLARPGEADVPVRLLHWSSENLHSGRADGAIRLLDELARHAWSPASRVLVWAHSHAGNALALATNLLAAQDGGASFFRAARHYYRTPVGVRRDLEHWPRVEEQLARRDSHLRKVTLDIATFGTPVRYGWDTGGYGRLLHVVHHRAADELPDWQAPLPMTSEEANWLGGDFIQQIGVAGTNFTPPVAAVRVWRTERRLRRLLESGVRRRDLLQRLRCGQRVPAEGTTLLVDYGPGSEPLAGHAVYTREAWLPFHAELITRWMYDEAARPAVGQDCTPAQAVKEVR